MRVLILRVTGGDGGSAFPALPALKKLAEAGAKAGCIIALVNAAPHGGFTAVAREHLRKHAPGLVLLRDMTAEAAVVKAMFLLTRIPSMKRIAELLLTDLRGEISSAAQTSHL